MSSTHEAVQNSANVQEALLHIAQSIDLILDNQSVAESTNSQGWGDWSQPQFPSVQVEQDTRPIEQRMADTGNAWNDKIESEGEVVIPEVSGEQKLQRKAFIVPFVDNPPQEMFKNSAGFEKAYIAGGGMWLYTYDRDYVMQMSNANKQGILADIATTHPNEVREVMRDILKEGAKASHDFEAATGGSLDLSN